MVFCSLIIGKSLYNSLRAKKQLVKYFTLAGGLADLIRISHWQIWGWHNQPVNPNNSLSRTFCASTTDWLFRSFLIGRIIFIILVINTSMQTESYSEVL